MYNCEDCDRYSCDGCRTHYCCEPCPCAQSHLCDCECTEYDRRMTYAD